MNECFGFHGNKESLNNSRFEFQEKISFQKRIMDEPPSKLSEGMVLFIKGKLIKVRKMIPHDFKSYGVVP